MPAMVSASDARTLLFVPGDRPDRFDKAAASGADGVILDLEDAVRPDHKDQARVAASSWLNEANAAAVVRINAPGTGWFAADIAALHGTRPTVMLPKATPATVAQAIQVLPAGSSIIALIETAAGLVDAAATAGHRGVVRLALGNIDLGAELGIDPEDHTALLFARSTLVVVSAAAGLNPPLDGVTPATDDPQALINDVRHSVSLGFTGKLCIHPRQVHTTHRALAPTAEQVRYARRVVAAAGDGGATLLDGKMLDKPVLDRARLILTRVGDVDGPL